MTGKLKMIISIIALLIIFSFSIFCGGYQEVKEKVDEVRSDSEEIELGLTETGKEESKTEEENETGLTEEVEYKLSAGNLITRIGDHLVLIGEVIDDYNYGDITLEEFKAYLGDFIMMFEESYYQDYLNLEPPVGYEDHYKYIGRFIEHIRKSTEYFQYAIDSENEDEMLDNLDKALVEIENGNEWLEEAKKEI